MTLSEINKQTDGNVTLFVTIEPDELISMTNAEFIKQRRNVNIPGFRKGKVPRNVYEKIVGKDNLIAAAIESKANDIFTFSLKESEIECIKTIDWDIVSSSDVEGATISFSIETYPEIEIKEYKGFDLAKHLHTVTDDMVMDEINVMRDKTARIQDVEDKETENGNIVVIDFKGYVNESAFSGGDGYDYSLEIGSNSFIPGFEEQIIGHKAGEEFSINLVFPESYDHEFIPLDDYEDYDEVDDVDELEIEDTVEEIHEDIIEEVHEETIKELKDEDEIINEYEAGEEIFDGSKDESIETEVETLAGKEVVFKIKIHQVQVKELPELDDDFVVDVSEFDTVQQLKDSIYESKTKEAEDESEFYLNQDIRNLLSEQVEIDLSESVFNIYRNYAINDYVNRLSSMGIPPEYLSQFIDMENIEQQMTQTATITAKTELALDYVARAEGLMVTDEALEDSLKVIAEANNKDIEEIRETTDFAILKRQILHDEAIKKIKEYAKITIDSHEFTQHDEHDHDHEHDHEHDHIHED